MKKILTVCATCAMFILGSLSVCAAGRSQATALINLETHQMLDADSMRTGEVMQVNVGNMAGKSGYRFYLDQWTIGRKDRIVVEKTLNFDATMSIPSKGEAYKAHLVGDQYENYQPVNWRFAGWSADGYAEYYGEWGYAEQDYIDHLYWTERKEDHTHAFGLWVVDTPSDIKNPGRQTRFCRVKWCSRDEHSVLDYNTYVGDINRQIRYAATGAVIECANPTYQEIAGSLMQELIDRPDVKVIQTYKDDTGKHVRQISAVGIVPIS